MDDHGPPTHDVCYEEKEEILNEFLKLTQPVKVWQDELVQLIQTYIIKEHFEQAMRFFSHVIQSGLNAYEKRARETQTGHGNLILTYRPVFVEFDVSLMPKILDMDRWKKILIALGFEIEEPDGYHRNEDMSIALGDGVMEIVLEGMLLLLTSLQEMTWNSLTMLIRLSRDEAISLDAMLQSSHGPLLNQQETKNICDKYPSEMKQLGFHMENKLVVKTTPRNTDFHFVIKGLFHGTSPDGDVFV